MAEDLRARFCQASAKIPDLPHLPVIPEEFLENENIVQFLQWFCDDVQSTNILTADELTRYTIYGIIVVLAFHIDRFLCILQVSSY